MLHQAIGTYLPFKFLVKESLRKLRLFLDFANLYMDFVNLLIPSASKKPGRYILKICCIVALMSKGGRFSEKSIL